MVYHQELREQHLARMVSRVPHNTDESAIHTRLLYFRPHKFTSGNLCILDKPEPSLYIQGVSVDAY